MTPNELKRVPSFPTQSTRS